MTGMFSRDAIIHVAMQKSFLLAHHCPATGSE